MDVKLTLSLDKIIIERSKIYAKTSGRSLSDIVESYLSKLISEESETKNISPKLKNLIGSVKLPKHFDEKQELDTYYSEKYK